MIMAAFSAQKRSAFYVCVRVCLSAYDNLVLCTCQHTTVSCHNQHGEENCQEQINRVARIKIRFWWKLSNSMAGTEVKKK